MPKRQRLLGVTASLGRRIPLARTGRLGNVYAPGGGFKWSPLGGGGTELADSLTETISALDTNASVQTSPIESGVSGAGTKIGSGGAADTSGGAGDAGGGGDGGGGAPGPGPGDSGGTGTGDSGNAGPGGGGPGGGDAGGAGSSGDGGPGGPGGDGGNY